MTSRDACDVTWNGPASGAIVTLVCAKPMPPPDARPSRAVIRNVIERSSRNPRQSPVGSHSEKHSRISFGIICEDEPVAAGTVYSQRPVLALVLLARTWSMSGNVRVGFVPARFRPGELYFSVSSGETSEVTPS